MITAIIENIFTIRPFYILSVEKYISYAYEKYLLETALRNCLHLV